VAANVHGIGGDVETSDAGDAGRGGHKSGEDAHGGGFAGAIGAEKAEDFAFVHGEGNVIDGGLIAVGLGEIFYFYQCVPPLRYEQTDKTAPPQSVFILKI
jgi:hypothetical protein